MSTNSPALPAVMLMIVALTIGSVSGQTRIEMSIVDVKQDVTLKYIGGMPGVSAYVESSTNLQPGSWQRIASGTFSDKGIYESMDTRRKPNFYRGVIGDLQKQGTEDVRFQLRLAAIDPRGQNTVTIRDLPSLGTLFQTNGSAINSAPATVANGSLDLLYLGPTNGFGTNFATFTYVVVDHLNNTTSSVIRVAISLVAVNDPPTVFPLDVAMATNEPVVFALPAADDPDDPGSLPYDIVVGPQTGALFQVDLSTNLTGVVTNRGEQIISGGTVVTSPLRLLWYEPSADVSGENVDSFWYRANDPHGAYGASQPVSFSIQTPDVGIKVE